MSKKSGFTLIELLVVITIIAVLATIGLTVYSGVQKSARSAKRVEDLNALKSALEVYYHDKKAYPATSSTVGSPNWLSECLTQSSDQVIPNLVPKYLVAFPHDPYMDLTNKKNCYYYSSDGLDYKLYDQVDTDFISTDYLSQPNLVDPNRDGNTSGATDAACKVDGSNITAWAIWSSCDPSKCGQPEGGSCWW